MINASVIQNETEKLFSIGKPSLENLSYVLRHPDTWPKGFVWNFNFCSACAMGLAHALWEQTIPSVTIANAASIMAREFAMPYRDAQTIFMTTRGKTKFMGFPRSPSVRDVTPEMVADQIDAYLARNH